jgi:hypothetical protein
MKRTHDKVDADRTLVQIIKERDAAHAAWQALVKEHDEHPEAKAAAAKLQRERLEASLPAAVRPLILDKEWPGKGVLEALTYKRGINDGSSSGPCWALEITVTFSQSGSATFFGGAYNHYNNPEGELYNANNVKWDKSKTAVSLWEEALGKNKQDPAKALAACSYDSLFSGGNPEEFKPFEIETGEDCAHFLCG